VEHCRAYWRSGFFFRPHLCAVCVCVCVCVFVLSNVCVCVCMCCVCVCVVYVFLCVFLCVFARACIRGWMYKPGHVYSVKRDSLYINSVERDPDIWFLLPSSSSSSPPPSPPAHKQQPTATSKLVHAGWARLRMNNIK
jgi:hypothetical protein